MNKGLKDQLTSEDFWIDFEYGVYPDSDEQVN